MADSLQWGNPDAFAYLWLLPVLLLLHLWAMRQRRRALELFCPEHTAQRTGMASMLRRRNFRFGLCMVAIALVIVALAQPQVGVAREQPRPEGAEVVIAFDTSLSMAARDIKPSRMEAARQAVAEIIGRLANDRVGIVLFAGDAYRYCPLTSDHDAALMFLEGVDIDSVPQPGTAIARALEVSAEMLIETDSKHRAVVLVSDGEDHSTNTLQQVEALNKEAGAVLLALGVGTPEGGPIPVGDPGGAVTSFHRDRQGQVVITRLYEDELRELARAGNGIYQRLSEPGAVAQISAHLAAIEGSHDGTYEYTDYSERFYWPLLFAILLLAVESIVSEQRMAAERRRLSDEQA